MRKAAAKVIEHCSERRIPDKRQSVLENRVTPKVSAQSAAHLAIDPITSRIKTFR
jgi:hypothetical protein